MCSTLQTSESISNGEATGPAFASGVLENPVMSTDLFIRNLGLNEGLLGDANIHGEWHHDVKGIYLDVPYPGERYCPKAMCMAISIL